MIHTPMSVLWLICFSITGHVDRVGPWGSTIEVVWDSSLDVPLLDSESGCCWNRLLDSNSCTSRSAAPAFRVSVGSFAGVGGFPSWFSWCSRRIQPLGLRRNMKFRAWLPWLSRSLRCHTYHGWMNFQISMAMDAESFEGKKKPELQCAADVLLHLNRGWSVEFWVVAVFDQPKVFLTTITIPHEDKCCILHLPQSLFIATFSCWDFECFQSGTWVCVHHVVARHGNLTWVRDAVFFTPCSSNSLWFDDFVLMILLWIWRIQSSRVMSDQSLCTESLPAWTVRVGWFGNFARHRWRSSHLRLSSDIFHDFVIIRIIAWKKYMLRCSLAATNSGFSSAHLFMALRQEFFKMFDHSSGQLFPSLVVTNLFLGQSALNPQKSFWWILVELFESCHTDPRFRQWPSMLVFVSLSTSM